MAYWMFRFSIQGIVDNLALDGEGGYSALKLRRGLDGIIFRHAYIESFKNTIHYGN